MAPTLDRASLQRLSAQRRREARALLLAGHFAGTYYLAGYAVECALKACIAKQTQRYTFPDKKLAQDSWTHDLERLVQIAGLAPALQRDLAANPALELNWAIVKDWKETARYELAFSRQQARDFYSACSAKRAGVLTWIRRRW